MITKTHDVLYGTRYQIEGSKELAFEEIGAPDGTTFLVRNIFYNTPARKKFLKSAQTEGGYVSDLMERLALSHPNIAFKFISNNHVKMQTTGNANRKDIIYHIYGKEIASSLLEIHADENGMQLDGFIGKPIVSRGNRNFENYFVNGRYIKSTLLSKGIEDAYRAYLMQHQYPFTALSFTVDGQALDVNVHPSKMELRFSDSPAVYKFLYETLSLALSKKEFIPSVTVGEDIKREPEKKEYSDTPEPFEQNRIEKLRASIQKDSPYQMQYQRPIYSVTNQQTAEAVRDSVMNQQTAEDARDSSTENCATASVLGTSETAIASDTLTTDAQTAAIDNSLFTGAQSAAACSYDEHSLSQSEKVQKNHILSGQNNAPVQEKLFLSEEAVPSIRVIGQAFGTYWIAQLDDKLFIVDQHAAHEKVLFERALKAFQSKEFTSQQISPPMLLTLSATEEEVFMRYKEEFEKLGYEISHFGGHEFAVSAVPGNLYDLNEKQFFLEMLDELAKSGGKVEPEILHHKLATMSCKAAVKGNSKLSVAEFEELLKELMTLEHPYHCPHGRPTMISMTKYELEKKFKRIV